MWRSQVEIFTNQDKIKTVSYTRGCDLTITRDHCFLIYDILFSYSVPASISFFFWSEIEFCSGTYAYHISQLNFPYIQSLSTLREEV
jgi:hypothetical protein